MRTGGLVPQGAKNVEVAKDFAQVLDPAGGSQRLSEGRLGPQYPMHAVDRRLASSDRVGIKKPSRPDAMLVPAGALLSPVTSLRLDLN